MTRPVDERAEASALRAGTAPRGLLLDRGFAGPAWVAARAAHGTRVVRTPGRTERQRRPAAVRRPVAALRHRLETTTSERTARLGENRPLDGSPRHGARTFWGVLTRVAATILAHTLQLLRLV